MTEPERVVLDTPLGALTGLRSRPVGGGAAVGQEQADDGELHVDVDAAVDAGVDLVGFILAAESPRRTDSLLAAPDTVLRVAVFVGEQHETDADLVQFYCRENGHRARDAALLRNDERVGSVVDLPWGEDDPSHLERARATEGRVMLAGGLGPDNVRAAISAVEPWAVDSARSTESSPGIKDHDAVRRWVEAARG